MTQNCKTMKHAIDDEDKLEPHNIGRIAYEAAAAATGCAQQWDLADQAKWTAAARGVLAWACNELDAEAQYGCPCNEDERVAWELTDKLRELAGLPRRDIKTPNAEVMGDVTAPPARRPAP